MSNEFFPEGYDIPKSGSNFMKLEKGESLFRVLDNIHIGYEYWTMDNKPVRSKTEFTDFPNRTDAKKNDKGEVIPPKHIWIIPVWNYTAKAVQILTIAQKTVQEMILSLGRDADWGNPMDYDIKVVREGDKFETSYTVSPKPKKELEQSIIEAYTKSSEGIQKTITEMFS